MVDEGADGILEVGQASRELTFLGGPLHRAGRRLGLVRGGNNSLPLGLAIGLGLWVVLVATALIEGIGAKVFSLSVMAGHVRLVAAIPLVFLGETWLGPRMRSFVYELVRSGIVRGDTQLSLDRAVARFNRISDSWLIEVFCLVPALAVIWTGKLVDLPGATRAYDPAHVGAGMTLAGGWYWFVCLPVFRFLACRWLLRLILWCLFLRRVAKLELHLVPTHPDGVGGLGYLDVVHGHFTPVVLAISAVISASFAEEMSVGTRTCASLYLAVPILLGLDAVLFLGPLCVFAAKLWACRVKGMGDYMAFAARYVDDFDKKWLRSGANAAESPLGTADLQSLADLSNSVRVVDAMRYFPGSWRMVACLATAALLPLLPLLLFQYPIAELTEKLIKALSGL